MQLECGRLVNYLHSTRELHLILRYDGLSLAKWHVDAAFGVHMDFKSHSGGMLSLHPKGGAIASGSNKQRLNTRSSTEAELVAADDFLAKILWTDRFMSEQGYNLKGTLYQDNRSAMILESKGRSSLGKRSRAINIRYFAIKDSVDKGELEILHCPTDDMVGDFFTKPLQGAEFLAFRNLILGGK